MHKLSINIDTLDVKRGANDFHMTATYDKAQEMLRNADQATLETCSIGMTSRDIEEDEDISSNGASLLVSKNFTKSMSISKSLQIPLHRSCWPRLTMKSQLLR